jgi:hypothetical protein
MLTVTRLLLIRCHPVARQLFHNLAPAPRGVSVEKAVRQNLHAPKIWEALMSTKDEWVVRVGRLEWARFARERETDPFQLLGGVRRGAAMGALAITSDGRYVQVNGDYVSDIDSSELRRAVQAEAPANTSNADFRAAPRPSGAPPVVVFKRRRRLECV